jgi:hypothetical protein
VALGMQSLPRERVSIKPGTDINPVAYTQRDTDEGEKGIFVQATAR